MDPALIISRALLEKKFVSKSEITTLAKRQIFRSKLGASFTNISPDKL